MTIRPGSPLAQVARVVASCLYKHDIDAVLTGGACASLYTRGVYLSSDLDFVVGNVRQRDLDRAMETIDFQRAAKLYRHPETEFFVEFLPGPLGIGRDLDIQPVSWKRDSTLRILSATDSCRDRLAAYYFWNDRQSLRAAVLIALRNPVDLGLIERWSAGEAQSEAFHEFKADLDRSRGRKNRRRSRE